MTTTIADTRQFASLDTPEGKKLIAKLLRDIDKPRTSVHIRADRSTDWKVIISKTIKGELGDPDTEVTIRTDTKISVYDNEYGHFASGSDSQPVTIPYPQYVSLSYSDVRTFLEFVRDGWCFRVSASRGSITSSKHNMGFMSLEAYHRNGNQSITIGYTSVFIDGNHVIRGTVD
jgi:hypothetical protein